MLWACCDIIRNVYARPCLTCVLRYSKSEYQKFQIWKDLKTLSSSARFLRSSSNDWAPCIWSSAGPCKRRKYQRKAFCDILIIDISSMIAKKSIKCQTPIKQPQTNTAEPCGKQTTYNTWCIVQYCGTMWNLKTSPQGQSSFVVSGPCPTRSGEKQWRARFHDASKLTKIDQHCLLSVTLLSPFGHPATTFHSLSSLPVFKNQKY